MLSLSAKKLLLPLLLLAAPLFFFFNGFSANAHERAIPYTIQKASSGNTSLNPEEKDVLALISNCSDNYLLIASLVFGIFCLVLIYSLIRSRHKRERFMEGYITETRIAKKVHDEIANEIYGAINYLTNTDNVPDDVRENILARLDDIYFMTKNISREANSIDTGYNFPEHLKMMLMSYSDSKINIILKELNNIDWNTIDVVKKIATYRCLQELMVNMKKHSQATVVIIDFHLNSKKIEITYTDNGLGATKEQLSLKNGLLNVESRMASIDGHSNFDISTGKGFHAQLIYPAHTPYVQKNFNTRRP